MGNGVIRTCSECGWCRKHCSRGLCDTCYRRAWKDGTLIDYERKSWAREELLQEWSLLRSEGFSKRLAAARLGMNYKTFEKALERASKAGEGMAA